MNLTILLSGSGSNFQAILDAISSGQLAGVTVVKVVADRECQGINRAIEHQIPFEIVSRKRPDFAEKLEQAIPKKNDLIVLAGFLSILPKNIIQSHPQKIINIHPSLLPKYGGKGMYGMNVHKAVIANQEDESGCTVHYVDVGIDTGGIIAQKKIKVYPEDSPESLQKRVLQQEHILLPEVIGLLAKDFTQKNVD